MKSIVKKVLIAGVVLAAAGLLTFFLWPDAEDEAKKMDKAGAGKAQQVENITASKEDTTFALNAGNTSIRFSCVKDLAGKIMAVYGGWDAEFDSTLDGEIVAGADGALKQIRVTIQMATLWSENGILTKALLERGFFLVKEHPTSTFISTAIRPLKDGETSSLEGATHIIEGNFKLNGIEKSISFPAAIEVTADALKLKSAFSLDRKEFNVNFVDSVGFGLLTDDNIAHEVAMKIKVDARKGASLAQGPDSPGTGTGGPEVVGEVDVAKLPPQFTETVPVSQFKFDMILVPGDPENGIKPLYFGKHEVSWDEFLPWTYCEDIADKEEHGLLRAKKLRPSPPYEDITRGFGTDGYPALSMSLLSAELYCKWLSAATGRRYRLPTEAEWKHAYAAGGGSLTEPPSEEEAEKIAVYDENSFDDFNGRYVTKPVGSMEPNKLGLHDMAGSVCEWVTGTGDERVALGGHFEGPRTDLGVGRAVESQDLWNMNYPNDPKSIWWFVDARWVGFRLVCEPTPDLETAAK